VTTAPPSGAVKLAAHRGQLAVTQFADDTLAVTAHGCALHLRPADALFLARVLAAMYLVEDAGT
jgi:hypothetical protein